MTRLERTIEVEGSLDLVRTFAFRFQIRDPTWHRGEREVWQATHTPEGPVTLGLRQETDTQVQATAVGPGAPWAIDQAPRLFGPEQPIGTDHARLRDLAKRHRGIRTGVALSVTDALVRTIIQQRVTYKDASDAKRKLVTRHGKEAPRADDAPVLRLPPDAPTLHRLRYFEYHPVGVERTRAETIRRVGKHGRALEKCRDLPLGEAKRRMGSIRGIGAWTVEMVAGTALGDPDAVPTGDYHLPNTVAWALAGEHRADDARMLELLEPFRPHRFRVIQLIEAAGIHAPRRGPRMPRMRWKE